MLLLLLLLLAPPLLLRLPSGAGAFSAGAASPRRARLLDYSWLSGREWVCRWMREPQWCPKAK